jgi:ATP-binding cassette subfamily B protein
MAMLSAGAASIILYAGAAGAVSGRGISIGTLTAFVVLFQRFFSPIIALGDDWQTVQSALSGIERIRQVLAVPAEGRPAGAEAERGAEARSQLAGAIEVREVAFGYFDDRPVLHGVSIAVAAGEHVAIVGRTGSGKSSLLSLVGGLYAPWSGSIRVGGRDPRGLSDAERGAAVGVVPQMVQLFSGSIMDNLTLGEKGASREAATRAAVTSGADAFIRGLPHGYDTPIAGSGRGAGVQLSSGQRQLLALTRALVFDPPVLVLDEATASVDSESDASFRAALEPSIARGRGVLTVAHRISSARSADRVIVLETGRIAEEGSPEDLIRQGGRFAAFLEMENAGWDWRTG